LPEKYPESACPVVLLKGHEQDLGSKLLVARRFFLAFVGVNVAAYVVLGLILDVTRERITKMWQFVARYLLILILYTSLGYPCALLEFRRWKQSLTLNEQHCAATGNAEYQLVKQSSVTNESALKKGEKERARDFSSQSIVGYK
jgi:hypothetical protein